MFSSQSYIQMYQETLNKLLEYDEIREGASFDEKKTQEVQEALDYAAQMKPSRHSSRRISTTKLNSGLQKQVTVDSQIEEVHKTYCESSYSLLCRRLLMRCCSTMMNNKDSMICLTLIQRIIIHLIWDQTQLDIK